MAKTAQGPEIQISPDAKRYILEQGGDVVIRPSPRHGCCGGKANVPIVDLGQPRDADDYQIMRSGHITVHMHRDVTFSKPLLIGVGGIHNWKKLWLDGAEMTP